MSTAILEPEPSSTMATAVEAARATGIPALPEEVGTYFHRFKGLLPASEMGYCSSFKGHLILSRMIPKTLVLLLF